MPTINLDFLKKQQVEQTHLYSDLALDLKNNSNLPQAGLFRESTTTDIEASYDEGAIKNSLQNLFTTMPGQKLLNPDYGLNLAQFLFMPATQSMARMIGARVLEGIEKYEPRVSVINVNVKVFEDESEYQIELALKIPKISDSTVSFAGILKQPGFSFV